MLNDNSSINLSSFSLDRMGVKKPITAGTYLYKFSDSDVFYTKEETKITGSYLFYEKGKPVPKEGDPIETEYFVRVSPYWARISDLYNLLHYSKNSNKSLLECVRNRNAVLHNWNGLNSLLIIKLKETVLGWEGGIREQTEKNYDDWKKRRGYSAPVKVWGGGSQVVIPNLTRRHIEVVVPAETVYIRDPIEDIIDFLEGYKQIV